MVVVHIHHEGNMMLTELRAALRKIGIRATLVDDTDPGGLNVFASPTARYAETTVWLHTSRTGGDGYVWGDRYQYGAPSTITSAALAAMVKETLT